MDEAGGTRKRKHPDRKEEDDNTSLSDDEKTDRSLQVEAAQQPQQEQQLDSNDSTTPEARLNPASEEAKEETALKAEGWRVKLYSLNPDGSWNDCGTGRMTCAYLRQPAKSSTLSPFSALTDKDAVSAADDWLYQETGEATLVVNAEPAQGNDDEEGNDSTDSVPESTTASSSQDSDHHDKSRVLLRARILLQDAYQRQGENLITWCEPYFTPPSKTSNNQQTTTAARQNTTAAASSGVDLALSFQEKEGCLDIWHQITQVQSKAAELLQSQSVQDLAAQVAAQHHASLCQQQDRDLYLWNNNSNGKHSSSNSSNGDARGSHDDSDMPKNSLHSASDAIHANIAQAARMAHINTSSAWSSSAATNDLASLYLPNPPTLQNLEDIADGIAALQQQHSHQQRENVIVFVGRDDCSYFMQLLALFGAAEARGDYAKLATLAACVKTILLWNDPCILELVVTEAGLFEQVCASLEYDPDLREKANHRWFLRERARFRTVVPMDDEELVAAIHRNFRVNYLRDTLLRPTMDESSLSTLSSLLTFTQADVVKGVTMAPGTDLEGGSLYDSYLVRVIDMLCVELHAITNLQWTQLEMLQAAEPAVNDVVSEPTIVFDKQGVDAGHTKQYLAPQDDSLSSRKMRRRGCLCFLKELFSMVRMSLQQNDKDDFFSVICTLDIDLNEGDRELADNVSQTSQQVEVGSVASTVRSDRVDDKAEHSQNHEIPAPTNLLSMLGNVLADPASDLLEKSAVLDILSGVVMHDPSLIRRHCLDFHASRTKKLEGRPPTANELSGRPVANERNQVLFVCSPNDLMMAFLFSLSVESDAGILLQLSEILRYVLDTDMMNDHGPMSAGFGDEADGLPAGTIGQPLQQIAFNSQQHIGPPSHPSRATSGTDEKQFLSLFYERYAEWLVAPFQFQILHPVYSVPDHVLSDMGQSKLMQERIMVPIHRGIATDEQFVATVPNCSIRSSFGVELLSFCVRAHPYRMKFFLLRSSVISTVLNLLRPTQGGRALKLAVLRFLRAILSANDEFYHRHIVQNDLFAPVFDALRMNPVGDNLLSSAIVEMCDYIHSENIVSLIEYVVTRHLNADKGGRNLEDFSSPYVSTLTLLRQAYESSLKELQEPPTSNKEQSNAGDDTLNSFAGGQPEMPRLQHGARKLSGKALEDQRKFREHDEEESYFDSDDGSFEPTELPFVENELHRTPRMFSLVETPLVDNMNGQKDYSSPKQPLADPHDDETTQPLAMADAKESTAVSAQDR